MGERTSNRTKKLVYHFTALSNLPRILEKGLCSRTELREAQADFADHADPDILEGRARHGLDRYVPFHFITRSPFDLAVRHRAPEERRFIVIAVHRDFAEQSGWKVIPMHPLMAAEEPRILEWQPGLDAIDWDQMDRRDYDDPECKLTCMAEALSPEPVLATQWQSIFVASPETQQLVENELRSCGQRTYVNVNKNMLPKGAL